MSMQARRISIIGAGKVGTAVAVLLSRAGCEVVAMAAPREANAEEAATLAGGLATIDNVEAARAGDVIFITTPDDLIGAVCVEIASGGGVGPGDCVFHMSGAASNDLLDPARSAGAQVGSIHPMQSFADVSGAVEIMRGAVFGVTAGPEGMLVAREVVEALEGTMVEVAPEQKVLYHAAACVASNCLVALADYAEEIYRQIGVSPETARRAYAPLVAGTASNIAQLGPTDALTGPIVRGDVGTVRDHLSAMNDAGIDSLPYRLLSTRLVEISVRRGAIGDETAIALLGALREGAPLHEAAEPQEDPGPRQDGPTKESQ